MTPPYKSIFKQTDNLEFVVLLLWGMEIGAGFPGLTIPALLL